MPELIVLIPTLPKPSLSKLLVSLQPQKHLIKEIIVSMDGTSPAKARNALFKKAQNFAPFDAVLFLDDDVIVAPDFIEKGLRGLFSEDEHFDYGQSRVIGNQENSPEKFIGTAMWMKRETFMILGGFDEDYPFFNEDIDFHICAQKKKMRCGFFADSVCWHHGRGAYEKLVEGNRLLELKHPKEYLPLKKELR